MDTRQKLILSAAALFVLALVIIFWPASQVAAPSADSAERPRPVTQGMSAQPVDRASRMSARPGSRPVRDLSTLLKLRAEGNYSRFPKLTRDQIDRFLEARSRSATALLTAYYIGGGDDALLREAMEKFPNDPQVQLATYWLFSDPAKRQEIVESLKHTDPENGLVDYLSAKYLFDLGKNDEALATLSQSVGKPLRDYAMLAGQNFEEAYLDAGYSPLEAKFIGYYGQTESLPFEMRRLADGLKKQRASDQSAGDDAAVQSSRELQVRLAGQLQQSGRFMGTLVGMDVEQEALQEIDSPEADARMEEIELERAAFTDGAERVNTMMKNPAVPENDWLLYFDRARQSGQKAANDWLLEKHPDL